MTVKLFSAFLIMALLGPVRWGAAAVVHHDLRVELYPHEHRFAAMDTITLPSDRPDTLVFHLHEGLAPLSPGHAQIEPLAEEGQVRAYRVHLPPGRRQFVLSYGGRLYHELEARAKTYPRGFRRTTGQISPEGVYLAGDAYWYPQLGTEFVTFSLDIIMPEGWLSVSQGGRTRSTPNRETWTIDKPQEQIFLIAGRFTEYARPAGRVQAMVFLRRPESELARTYLSATAQYIELYERLLGPYPYAKFALVENYWETGFGMPSFTLMGSKVIRFPFILHSSYPHEILHSWWGNAVYPAYAAGNWSEGLTAYLSDHLLQEQRGQGADYRQTVLQKYADYVSGEKDLPLVAFTGRHSSASEAVGYGKSMMFFHMLRRQLGDETFITALRAFYQDFQFKRATFADLRQSMAAVAGEPLEKAFAQWVYRTGAPRLAVAKSGLRVENGRYVVTVTLRQHQPGAPYELWIPLAVTLAGERAARMETVHMRERVHEVTFSYNIRPLRLDVDPRCDLFRKLDRLEIPPALSQVFGAQQILVVLPADAPQERLAAYKTFARSLEDAGPEKVDRILDRDIDRLPADRNIVLLGWENRFRDIVASQIADYGVALSLEEIALKEKKIVRQEHSTAVTARHPDNTDLTLAWIAADPIEALAGLARKLPHYHKYSYLGFTGNQPENIAKGRWPVLDSPMTVFFTEDRTAPGTLPEENILSRQSGDEIEEKGER